MPKKSSNKKFEYSNKNAYTIFYFVSVVLTGIILFSDIIDCDKLLESFVSRLFYLEIALCFVNILVLFLDKILLKHNNTKIKTTLIFLIPFIILVIIVFLIKLLYSCDYLCLNGYNLYLPLFGKCFNFPNLPLYCTIIVKTSELLEFLISAFTAASHIVKIFKKED